MSAALPLRAEVRRQVRRRRTQLSFGFLLLLPLLLVGAFALGDDDDGDSGAPSFVDLAQQGPANFAVFALFVSTGFLLVVLVALYAGDAVPSEASWSTLRYLLAAPVPRARLLRVKLSVAALTSVAALVLLPVWCLIVGTLAYGTGSFEGPSGEQLSWGEFALRLLVIVGYLFVNLLFVLALAFFVGVLTDAPLGAVGGAVLLTIVSSILDAIPALGDIRDALPTHFQFAWADALQRDIEWSGMATGSLWSVGYAVVLLSAAFALFARQGQHSWTSVVELVETTAPGARPPLVEQRAPASVVETPAPGRGPHSPLARRPADTLRACPIRLGAFRLTRCAGSPRSMALSVIRRRLFVMHQISFEVAGLPPIKNEALSLFNPRHDQAAPVQALLRAARDELVGSQWDPGSTAALSMYVVLRGGGQRVGDATNYLGGIGDVLEDKRRRQALDHLGELATVSLYRNDAQLHDVRLSREDGPAGYRVTLREVARPDDGPVESASAELAEIQGVEVEEFQEMFGGRWVLNLGPIWHDYDADPSGGEGYPVTPWHIQGDPPQLMIRVFQHGVFLARPEGTWMHGMHILEYSARDEAYLARHEMSPDRAAALVGPILRRRRRTFRWCPICRGHTPPELSMNETCMRCFPGVF